MDSSPFVEQLAYFNVLVGFRQQQQRYIRLAIAHRHVHLLRPPERDQKQGRFCTHITHPVATHVTSSDVTHCIVTDPARVRSDEEEQERHHSCTRVLRVRRPEDHTSFLRWCVIYKLFF